MKTLIAFILAMLLAATANAGDGRLVQYLCYAPQPGGGMLYKNVCAEKSNAKGMDSPAFPCVYDLCWSAGPAGSQAYLTCLAYITCAPLSQPCSQKCTMPRK